MTISRKIPSECPIERCIAALSGRWKARILWCLFVEPQRYTALEAALPRVPQRALSQALNELAADGLVIRREEAWALTPLGEAIRPTLAAMHAWGSMHRDAAELRAAAPVVRLVAGARG